MELKNNIQNLYGSNTQYELKSKNKYTPKDQKQKYKTALHKINQPKLSRKVLHRIDDILGET